jgi:hypothetical protein
MKWLASAQIIFALSTVCLPSLTLCKVPHLCHITGLIHRKSGRDSMLGGYTQLQTIAQNVLPAINQTKTLLFTQYLYYTMALSTIGNYSCL